jgi:hypothetical protein
MALLYVYIADTKLLSHFHGYSEKRAELVSEQCAWKPWESMNEISDGN